MNSTTSTATPERNVTAFFILVIVMSIPLYILAALVPEEMVLFLAVTLAPAPITAALILTYRETGSEGARRLLRRSFDYRRITRKSWYVPIFFLVPVLFFLALGLMVLMGEPVPEPLFPVVAAPVAFLAFFLFALFEEVGWMGYAFDPMQGRRPALTASILLGIPWALWHLPFYLFSGLDPLWIAGQLFALLAIRLLIAWIYNNTGKSIFATILFHAVYNVCTLAMPSYYSSLGHALTSVLLVIAAGVVIFLWGPETLAQFKFKNKEQVH